MKEIIQEHRSRIRAIIKKITGSYNEDIEQDVYIKTWQNLDKYQESGKFKQWISAITANVCRDYFKSGAYRHSACSTSDDEVLENVAVAPKQELALDARQRQKIILYCRTVWMGSRSGGNMGQKNVRLRYWSSGWELPVCSLYPHRREKKRRRKE